MNPEISKNVKMWIEKGAHPEVRRITVIRKSSPWYGMSEEEIEDCKEFIRYHLMRAFELLLLIPVQPREDDFWFSTHQEFMESAFNTHDFQKDKKPCDKYGYRVRKILEQVQDLALLHSCISQPEGRKRAKARFEALVENEFKIPLLEPIEKYRRTNDEERRAVLRQKIAKISRHIQDCQRIWQRWPPWEDSATYHGSANDNRNSQTSSLRQEEVFQQ